MEGILSASDLLRAWGSGACLPEETFCGRAPDPHARPARLPSLACDSKPILSCPSLSLSVQKIVVHFFGYRVRSGVVLSSSRDSKAHKPVKERVDNFCTFTTGNQSKQIALI